MKGQRVLLAIGSIALSAILLLILARVGSVDARSTLGLLMNVSFSSFARLLLLNTFLVYFSSEKWRSIDVASRRRTDSVPSRMNAMAFTALGFALGLVLPIQIAMATARTLGIYGHDKPIKRGIAWTLFEQVFDIGLVFFLGAASLATYLFHGGPKLWIPLAFSSVAIAFLSVSPCIRLASRFAAAWNARLAGHQNRTVRALAELLDSGVLNVPLARRLLFLSLARYGVVVLMSLQTADAIGVHLPAWQMAATVPFVGLASIIAITPGGIGVNELTSVGALQLFGIPVAVGAQWAVANRVLVAASYSLVAVIALLLLFAKKARLPIGDVVRDR